MPSIAKLKKSWNINPQMETHNRYSGALALKRKEILSCGKHASTLRIFYQVIKPLNKKTNTLQVPIAAEVTHKGE